MNQHARRAQKALALLPVVVMLSTPQRVQAANGAFAVDAADISDLGTCKFESWLSTATNADFSAVANPSCVVNIVRPVELSLLTNRFRSGGDWGTSIAPKAKINLLPTGIGKFGVSAFGGVAFDAATGENTAVFGEIPITYRLSELMRINLNAGWLWDRTVDRHFFTYGAGFDWKLTDVFEYTIEMFGQVGRSEIASVVQPKFQTGLRYRPNEIFSIDVIYGHNITGENADWITIGTTFRFPAPKGAGSYEGGHL
jgi:hypothetical protein